MRGWIRARTHSYCASRNEIMDMKREANRKERTPPVRWRNVALAGHRTGNAWCWFQTVVELLATHRYGGLQRASPPPPGIPRCQQSALSRRLVEDKAAMN